MKNEKAEKAATKASDKIAKEVSEKTLTNQIVIDEANASNLVGSEISEREFSAKFTKVVCKEFARLFPKGKYPAISRKKDGAILALFIYDSEFFLFAQTSDGENLCVPVTL